RSPIDWAAWRDVVRGSLAPGGAAPYAVPPPADRRLCDGLVAASALVLLILARRHGRVGWSLVAGVVVPIDLAILCSYLSGRTMIVPRYFRTSASLLLIGSALVIGGVRDRRLRWGLAWSAFCALAYCSAAYRLSLAPAARGAAGAADYVARHRAPGDLAL